MTEDQPSADASSRGVGHPASLDPKSLGCILPAVLIVLIVGLAWLGMQKILGNTGEWSLKAAEFGLMSSGLPSSAKEPFEGEIGRLRTAHEDSTLAAQEVVEGVGGLLETRTIQLLVLDDVRRRRLPASGLSDDERAAADATLEKAALCVDGGQLPLPKLLEVLGPLIEVPEDGSVVALDDEGLRALVARATDALEGVEPPEVPRDISSEALLERFRAHVSETLASAATKS